MKNVKPIALALVAICLLVVPLAWSQGGNPPASTNAKQSPPAAPIKIGDLAPDFTLVDQNGQSHSLHDYKGKKNVALAFYVFAFGPNCTQQMRNFQQNLTKLEATDTQVLGVSMDSPFANKAFADQNGITF
ncbi:MAG TPA: redoxin domain-containing protein [Terriglobales bacterium]|nr:redoxin domain-containing protein [Terriglobales bacterium]